MSHPPVQGAVWITGTVQFSKKILKVHCLNIYCKMVSGFMLIAFPEQLSACAIHRKCVTDLWEKSVWNMVIDKYNKEA